MKRSITVEHNGKTYHGQVAKIESTYLGTEDHGILTAYLHVKGDGWGVGVGGYALDAYSAAEKRRIPTAYGLDHIVQLVRTVGTSRWEDLPGRDVIVLYESEHPWGATAAGIAHVSDESKVLILAEHAEKWRARESEAVSA